MLLIQLKLIINLLLLLIDFILLIKLMPAKMAVDQRPYGRRPRLEGPRIKAWTSRLWDYWEIGQPAPPPSPQATVLWSAVSSASAPVAKLFSCAKGNFFNCREKCHHVWSSSLSGMVYCYSTVPLALSYGRDDQ